MQFPKIFSAGCSLLALAAAGGIWSAHWSATRTWVPVDMPIGLTAGHVRTQPFTVNVSEDFRIDIEAKRSIPEAELFCLLGTEDAFAHTCGSIPSAVRATWTLTSGGTVVASDRDPAGNGFVSATGDGVDREIGQFDSQAGHTYVLNVDGLEDSSRLALTHPRLKVHASGFAYEDDAVRQLLVLAGAGALALIGFGLLVLAWVRFRHLPLSKREPLA